MDKKMTFGKKYPCPYCKSKKMRSLKEAKMFDEDPKDQIESFHCKCGGDITKQENGDWECNQCDFCYNTKEAKNAKSKN